MTEEQKQDSNLGVWYIFEGDDIVTFFLRVKGGAVDDQGKMHDAGLKLSPKSEHSQKLADDILLELQAKAASKELKIKWLECEVITKEEFDKEFSGTEEDLNTTDPEIYVKKPGQFKRRIF